MKHIEYVVPAPSFISCVALGKIVSFSVSFLKWVLGLHLPHRVLEGVNEIIEKDVKQ